MNILFYCIKMYALLLLESQDDSFRKGLICREKYNNLIRALRTKNQFKRCENRKIRYHYLYAVNLYSQTDILCKNHIF